MKSKIAGKRTTLMKNKIVGALALLFVATITFVTSSGSAQDATVKPPITIDELAGPWQATLVGNTGCGLVSMLVNFTLNSSGAATDARITTHLSAPSGGGCIDGSVTTGQTFTIDSLHSNGSGTASLSCGPDCGWGFQIQVAPNHEVANLTDVATGNPYNTPTGTMILQ